MTALSEYRMAAKRSVKLSFSETFRTIFSPVTLFFWLGMSVVCAIAAPFDTDAMMDWALRLTYWFVVVSAAMVLGYVIRALGDALVGRDQAALFDLFAIGAATAALSPVVWLVSNCDTFNFKAQLPGFPMLSFYVFSVAALVFVGRRLTPGFEPSTYRFLRRRADTDPMQPRLLRRLFAR